MSLIVFVIFIYLSLYFPVFNFNLFIVKAIHVVTKLLQERSFSKFHSHLHCFCTRPFNWQLVIFKWKPFFKLAFQDFVPTKQDVLHARKATKGIVEHEFIIKGIPFKMVDVGGQRSQRAKWFQCFDEVTSILFLVSSSAFDQVLMEDRTTNRLVESCNIFETIVNNKFFANVSIILFLNKTDLLMEKIKYTSIKDYFPAFQGDPHKIEDVQNFILQMFDSKRRERSKALFHHFTTAIDTENIKFVFHAVKDTILQDNLKSLMLQWIFMRNAWIGLLHQFLQLA